MNYWVKNSSRTAFVVPTTNRQGFAPSLVPERFSSTSEVVVGSVVSAELSSRSTPQEHISEGEVSE